METIIGIRGDIVTNDSKIEFVDNYIFKCFKTETYIYIAVAKLEIDEKGYFDQFSGKLKIEKKDVEKIIQDIGKWEYLSGLLNNIGIIKNELHSLPVIRKEEIEYAEEETNRPENKNILVYKIVHDREYHKITDTNLSFENVAETIKNIERWRNFKGLIKEIISG